MKNIKIIVLLLVVILIFWFLLNKNQHKNIATIETGTIEGSLSYPSNEIPKNMEICAENTLTNKQYCTTQHIEDKKYKYNIGYKIDVPIGTYYVFAKSQLLFGNVLKDQQAYYSEFVTCGMSKSCSSHNHIQIIVKSNEITKDINPWDWYENIN